MAEEGNKVVDLNSAYRHKVDAKGRMSLPASFRKVLSTDLVVTRNPKDECLYVFEPDAFNAWVAGVFEDKFEKFDRTNDLHVRLRRKLKSRERLGHRSRAVRGTPGSAALMCWRSCTASTSASTPRAQIHFEPADAGFLRGAAAKPGDRRRGILLPP